MEYYFTKGQEWIPWKEWCRTNKEIVKCAWCGKDLFTATNITCLCLNGNQPVCDLCLIRAGKIKLNPEED